MNDNSFQTELQSALGELQQHLRDLGAAKTQIEHTKNAASNVVEGIDNLSEGYVRHLDKLTTKIDGFLEQITTRVNTFHDEAEARIHAFNEKAETRIETFSEKAETRLDTFSEKTETRINAFSEKVENRIDTFSGQVETRIDSFNNEAETRIKALQDNYEAQSQALVSNIQTSQAAYSADFFQKGDEQLLDLVNSTNESIETTLVDMRSHVAKINDAYSRQNGQMQEYIVRFSQLLGVVQDLEQRISEINFPELFGELNTTIITLDKHTQSVKTEVGDLKKMIRAEFANQTRTLENKLDTQAGQLRFLRIVVLVMALVGLGVLLWYFLS